MLVMVCATRAFAQASDTLWSSAASEARAHATADSLRRAVLRLATFAGFADTTCVVGELRTFEGDAEGGAKKALAALEQLVWSYGVNAPLDNEQGRALMRTLARIETGGPPPRWDTATGTGPRSFNPVISSKLYDPTEKKCVQVPGVDPDGLLLPKMSEFTPPRDSGAVEYDVGYGPDAVNALKNVFYARHRSEKDAILHTTRVTAYAMWQDYALVGVVREQEQGGVLKLGGKATGALYAFHRAGSEWRLLAIVRSW